MNKSNNQNQIIKINIRLHKFLGCYTTVYFYIIIASNLLTYYYITVLIFAGGANLIYTTPITYIL